LSPWRAGSGRGTGRGGSGGGWRSWRVRQLAAGRAGLYHSASCVPVLHPERRQRVVKFRRPAGATSPTIQPNRVPLMKTFSAKAETVQRDWYVVDAAGKTLGRLSSEIARRLRG